MTFEFNNNKPIYLQIVDILKLKIISGEISTGSKLKSVRDLALDFEVNPNTMQRALTELEREELVFSQRTVGRFVTENTSVLIHLREELAKIEISELYSMLIKLGYKKEELTDVILKNLKELE